jgi:hypothetical protein
MKCTTNYIFRILMIVTAFFLGGVISFAVLFLAPVHGESEGGTVRVHSR